MDSDVLNANKRVATWHERLQRCGFKFLTAQFVCSLIGGPQHYTGRPIDVSHKHLGISSAEWEEFMRLFMNVCMEQGLDVEATRALRDLFTSVEGDCTLKPGEQAPPNPGPQQHTGDTLYARLGGVYPIALFTDRLIDALLVDDRVGLATDEERRTEPSLKYLFTEVFCNFAGGSELITAPDLEITKLLVPKAAWQVFLDTAEIAADHMPRELIPEVLAALQKGKHFIVDASSAEPTTSMSGAAAVKDVLAAAAGKKLSSQQLAARRAAPGAHVAARRRVFGDPRTLYGRVGGIFGLARFASIMMDKWMQNDVLNANHLVARWHETNQVYGFKFFVTQILAYLTGGPQRYTGRDMELSHKHLNITLGQWDHFMQEADKVLGALVTDPVLQRSLRSILAGFRDQCILRPGERLRPEPGPSRPGEDTVGTTYHTLGGVYPIARYADMLVEAVLEGSRVQVEWQQIDDPMATRHPPGLKYMVTELICRCTGGPEVITSRAFDPAKLGIQPQQWPAFMQIAAECADKLFPQQGHRSALLSAMKLLKYDICVGLDEGGLAADAAGAPVVEASAAGPQDVAGVPTAAQSATPPPRCPFSAMMGRVSPSAVAPHPLPSSRSPSPPQQGTDGSKSGPGALSKVAKFFACSGGCDSEQASGADDECSAPLLAQKPALHSVEEKGPPKLIMAEGRLLGNPLQEKLDDLLTEDPDLCCPISLTLLVDPVVASDGFVYERSSFNSWCLSGRISPMSQEPLSGDFNHSAEHKDKAIEFRRARSHELLSFAERFRDVEPQLVASGLNRIGEYVQVLRPEKVPELATKAAKVWEDMGHAPPPELSGGASTRNGKRSKAAGGAWTSGKSVAGPAASIKRPAAGADFQHRLNMLVSTKDGSEALGKKLYLRFSGETAKLGEVQGFLEDKWGFPTALFPILWSHLRRCVFQRRGAHFSILVPSASGQPQPAQQEAIRIEEPEWVDAFIRWIQALHARTTAARVGRTNLVHKRLACAKSDIRAEYFEGPKLGEGAFGEVFIMLHKGLGVERVVKVIHKDQLTADAEDVESEVSVLKSLDHPHIVRIYETFDTDDALHIVMDFAQGGDLATLLKKANNDEMKLSETWVRHAIEQVIGALEYMHSKGVIHCDLKPANTMLLAHVDLEAGDNDPPHLLLVDFGLSELFEEQAGAGGAVKMKGTPLYLSPEAFEGHLSEKSDMWATGIMLYEMLLLRRPFQEGSVFVLWSKIAKTEPKLDDLPGSSRDVVKALLMKDPATRPTARGCREMAWFSEEKPSTEAMKPKVRPSAIGATNYFHRAAALCIAAELSMKDMPDVFETFKAIDKSGSGRLTQSQLAEGLQMLGITQDPAEIMALLDMDQSGDVSYTEFLAGILSTDGGLSERHMKEAFDMFDIDGDGSISTHELRSMLSGDGPLVDILPDGHSIDDIIAEAGNGEGIITFASFKKYLESASTTAAPPVLSAPAFQSSFANGSAAPSDFVVATRSAASSPTRDKTQGSPASSMPGSKSKRFSIEDMMCDVEHRFNSPDAGKTEEDTPAPPPLHAWLATTLGESAQQTAALQRLLQVPERGLPPKGALAMHAAALKRHFLAAARFAEMLEGEPPNDLRLAVLQAASEVDVQLPGVPAPVCSI